MPLVDEDRGGGGVQYSFAVEYDGPPLPYDLPQAVPINIGEIPVAAVVSQVADELPLPVVKPLLSSVISGGKDESATTTVSPTSVIERAAEKSLDSGMLSGELSSSGAIEFSESLSTVRVSEELNHDWGSNLSVLSAEYPSSRVSSVKPASGECGNGDGRRGQVVTFVDVDSDGEDGEEEGEVGNDEEEYYEDRQQQPRRVIQQVKREPQSKGKKGTCYRCFKGNRFTEKEVCLVCDAKYCSNCVLRAMGSMPEGRKCLNCIAYPIDESKRANLGKCSRVLKRLLNDLEVRQIMKAEKFCEANQLPPEYVCVNGMPLCHEELVLLQSCANPPKKLKPGNYWYDKVSGLWGKEGQKPSQIVSAHMNVGGPIDANASNGNTQVYINGREITKVELRMLQLAGVQCAGNPHFWVNDDGSYQEEGQKNTKGYIWGKGAMKLVCTFLSLPVPSKSCNDSEEQVNSLPSRSMPDYLEQRTLLKILLVGYSGSGTSTIFKQAKILYQPTPFTEDERENIKLTIQSNVYGYLGILLEGRDRFEEESSAEARSKDQLSNQTDPTGDGSSSGSKTVYSIGPRLKSFSDWLLKTMVSGNLDAIFPAATREYAPLVEELWKDPAIQATYNRKNELEMLPSVASYFLERAVEILAPDYEPSDLDILYAEGVTSSNGVASLDFSFPQSAYSDKFDHDEQHDYLLRYQLIRLQPRGIGENCKWLEMFEDIGMVVFCVSLSDYDQVAVDGNGCATNKMMLSRKFFETIVTHPTFEQMDVLLILNKFDTFEDKIERVPLTECEWFDDFHPLVSRHRSTSTSTSSRNINHSPSLGQLGFHYIAVKFKRLYASLTGRKLFVSMVKALEPDSVDSSLKYAREIMKWEDERPNFSVSEYSVYSTEASSYTP
ncbi:Extra-large guanine nucleotide-binding protein 1 [Linum perenne]